MVCSVISVLVIGFLFIYIYVLFLFLFLFGICVSTPWKSLGLHYANDVARQVCDVWYLVVLVVNIMII